MTAAERSALVLEGFRIDQDISPRLERLKEIKRILGDCAGGSPSEFTAEGCRAKVHFSSKLISRLSDKQVPWVKKICGAAFFPKLFCSAPIKDFEKVATALLGDEKGEELTKSLKGFPFAVVSFEEVKTAPAE